LIEIIWILVICFTLLFSVRVFQTMREIWIYEEYYITMYMWNSPLSCGRIVLWPWWTSRQFGALGLFLREDEPASGTHTCRSLASCNHTMQSQLTNRIGVFRHRNTAV
jgi:hypothetical protein